MSQGPAQSGVYYVSSKPSPASDLINEDYLKKITTKTTTHPFKPGKNKKMPPVKHSPFGNFPKEKMPKKHTVEEPEPIDHFATSIAITGNSKFIIYMSNALCFILEF